MGTFFARSGHLPKAVKKTMLEIPPDAPAEYANLVNACLALEKSERPTFDEIIPKLEAMLATLPI